MDAVSSEIISHLNNVLSDKLASINSYFLHARMMKHMGFMKFADYEYKESIQQMKYADKLIERILSIGGVPDIQETGKIIIGNTVEEILRLDLEIEEHSYKRLMSAIGECNRQKDMATLDMLNSILESKEERMIFIGSQLNLVDTIGLPKYLQIPDLVL